MPTARPIIIEKFIDHTDIGVDHPSTCKSANPTAIPASASTSGNPAAIVRTEREEQQDEARKTAETSSALWSASALILLKSLHTAHSPVTFAVAPGASVSLST